MLRSWWEKKSGIFRCLMGRCAKCLGGLGEYLSTRFLQKQHLAVIAADFEWLYSHCITFTSFPRGIHSPLVGAWARKLLAASFPGSAGMQSSGLSSCSCNNSCQLGTFLGANNNFPKQTLWHSVNIVFEWATSPLWILAEVSHSYMNDRGHWR